MNTFKHPVSGKPIYGRAMNKGETIQATDFYPSTTGDWFQAGHSMAGLELTTVTVLWIRPEIDIL